VSTVPPIPPDGGSILENSGSIAGAQIPANSLFAVVGPLVNTAKPDGQDIAIISTTLDAWTCKDAISASATSKFFADTQTLIFGVENESGSVSPGTYSVGGQASAGLNTSDAACHTTSILATSGTITISQIGTDVTGSYDLTFGSQGEITGSFAIPLCAQPPPPDPAPEAGTPVCLVPQ
jgi:hypothetical protein